MLFRFVEWTLMNSGQCWISFEITDFLCEPSWKILIQLWTLLAQKVYMVAQKHCKNIAINSCNAFLLFAGCFSNFYRFFVLVEEFLTWNQKEIHSFSDLCVSNYPLKSSQFRKKMLLPLVQLGWWKCSSSLEFWLGHNFELSWKNSGNMQLNFCSDTTWDCLRIISVRCNWISATSLFGIVLEKFRLSDKELRLKQFCRRKKNLNIFEVRQVWDRRI